MNVLKQTRLVALRTRVLKHNDVVARDLREEFLANEVCAISLVSSPGAGKTALLEQVLGRLIRRYRVAALVGDLATDNDARRLGRSGALVRQITTGTVCHLEAEMVRTALLDWSLRDLDFLFIENVGNLVCPATFDLGEQLRLVLFSVTEGEDKPLKYPTIFNSADAAVITKIDLAQAVECDLPAMHRNLQGVRPGIEVLEVSAKSGQGLDQLLTFVEQSRLRRRPGT